MYRNGNVVFSSMVKRGGGHFALPGIVIRFIGSTTSSLKIRSLED